MEKNTNDFKLILIILLDSLENKIKKEFSDIGYWAHVMTAASGKLHNVNMTKADKLYAEVFFKASAETAYKPLYSQREITNFLNRFSALGKFKKFLECTARILTLLKETQTIVRSLKTSVKLFKLGRQIGVPSVSNSSNNRTVEDIERQMEQSITKFSALMEALRTLNTLSPPGFREYFEYGAGIFRNSQRLVKITKEYTQRLKTAGNEAERTSRNTNSKNNNWFSTTLAAQHDNAVDIVEQRR